MGTKTLGRPFFNIYPSIFGGRIDKNENRIDKNENRIEEIHALEKVGTIIATIRPPPPSYYFYSVKEYFLNNILLFCQEIISR